MTDLGYALQVALIAVMRGDATLATFVGARVYDAVPGEGKREEFPYISLGPDFAAMQLAECVNAADHTIQIDIWSRTVGFPEAKKIGSAVIAALHDQSLTIDGGAVQSVLLESANYVRDADGKTSRGILIFNILVDANQ